MASSSKKMKVDDAEATKRRTREAIRKLPLQVVYESLAMLPLDDQERLQLIDTEWRDMMVKMPLQQRGTLTVQLGTGKLGVMGIAVIRLGGVWSEYEKEGGFSRLTEMMLESNAGQLQLKTFRADRNSHTSYPQSEYKKDVIDGWLGRALCIKPGGFARVFIEELSLYDELDASDRHVWPLLNKNHPALTGIGCLKVDRRINLTTQSRALKLFKRHRGRHITVKNCNQLAVLKSHSVKYVFESREPDQPVASQIVNHLFLQMEGAKLQVIAGGEMRFSVNNSLLVWRELINEVLEELEDRYDSNVHHNVELLLSANGQLSEETLGGEETEMTDDDEEDAEDNDEEEEEDELVPAINPCGDQVFGARLDDIHLECLEAYGFTAYGDYEYYTLGNLAVWIWLDANTVWVTRKE